MDKEELKRERIEIGITQAELAEILGTTVVTVGRWEAGIREINEGWARLGLAEARRRYKKRPSKIDGRQARHLETKDAEHE